MCFLFSSVFKAAPPLPPTTARILPTASSEESYGSSIKRLVTNKSYMTLLVTYGVNVGVFYAMSTLLNQIVLSHYPVSRNYFKSHSWSCQNKLNSFRTREKTRVELDWPSSFVEWWAPLSAALFSIEHIASSNSGDIFLKFALTSLLFIQSI